MDVTVLFSEQSPRFPPDIPKETRPWFPQMIQGDKQLVPPTRCALLYVNGLPPPPRDVLEDIFLCIFSLQLVLPGGVVPPRMCSMH